MKLHLTLSSETQCLKKEDTQADSLQQEMKFFWRICLLPADEWDEDQWNNHPQITFCSKFALLSDIA